MLDISFKFIYSETFIAHFNLNVDLNIHVRALIENVAKTRDISITYMCEIAFEPLVFHCFCVHGVNKYLPCKGCQTFEEFDAILNLNQIIFHQKLDVGNVSVR